MVYRRKLKKTCREQEQLEDAYQIKVWRKLSPYEKPTIVIGHGQEEEEEGWCSSC